VIAASHQVALRHQFQVKGRPPAVQPVTAKLPPPPEPMCSPAQLAAASKLIVRRDAGLGDCLMILPTLAAIRQRFPRLEIVFQAPAEYTVLLEGFAEVDEAIALEESPAGHPSSETLFVDLSNYMERHPQAWQQPRIDLVGTAFGIAPLPRAAAYHPALQLQHQAKNWLATHGCRAPTRIAVALRGIYGHRSWLVPYVFGLARQLITKGQDVLIFDADMHAPQYPGIEEPTGETPVLPRAGTVAHAYGLELPLVAALLADCDGAVVPDTGLLHLAACVGLPFVAIFGAVPPELRLNHYENYRCLTAAKKVACVPCYEGPQHMRCNYECLWEITPTMVATALQELLGEANGRCPGEVTNGFCGKPAF